MGVTPNYAVRLIREAGVAVPPPARPRKDADGATRAEVVRLYREGKTMKEVGAVFGRSLHWTQAHLVAAEVPRRRPGAAPRPELRAQAAQLYTNGMRLTICQVASIMGVSRERVTRLLKRARVKVRRGRPIAVKVVL